MSIVKTKTLERYFTTSGLSNQRRTKGVIKGLIPPKLPKLYLAPDAEYHVNLINVNT